jgi:8-oxo-dGTP diphosphatase
MLMKSKSILEDEVKSSSGVALSVDCVVFGFDEGKLKLLCIKSDYEKYKNMWSFVGNLLPADKDPYATAVAVLKKKTSLDKIFLQQIKTYGDLKRHPAGRVVTIVYCALINVKHYKLKLNDLEVAWVDVNDIKEMAFDHYKILQDCRAWLEKELRVEPIAFNLLQKKFTLRELQEVYDAILREKQDRRNFRKKILSQFNIQDVNEMETNVTHRPGKLYKFVR